MLKSILLVVVFALPTLSFADEGSDQEAINTCLHNWGKNPFGKTSTEFRSIGSKVRVFGIGDGVNDETVTDGPELVLVKPNITVMSKTEMRLMNPKGWYCLKANVAVLGKTTIHLDCQAKLASSKEGATVLGASDRDGSVAVLGSARIEKEGCSKE